MNIVLKFYDYGQSGLYYRERINNIRQQKIKGETIFAKPVLLLALIDGIEEKVYSNNHFVIDGWLEEHYSKLLSRYAKDSQFEDKTGIEKPFWHLETDGFWHLFYPGERQTKSHTPTLRWLKENVYHASFDDDLWTLLQDRTSRQQLRDYIVEHKLSDNQEH